MDLRREEKKEEWMELDVNLSLEWKSTAVCCGGGDFPAECTHKSQSAHRKTHCLTAMPNYQRGCEFVFLKRSFSFQIWTAKWNGIYWEKSYIFMETVMKMLIQGMVLSLGGRNNWNKRNSQTRSFTWMPNQVSTTQQKGKFLVHGLLNVHNHRAQK